jgi:nitrate reductase assembly molybdenum cofactor insertion protein NarJ
VVTELNKILENVNEVMTWLEQQTDSEHLLLTLASIKQYVISSDEVHYVNIFISRNKCE